MDWPERSSSLPLDSYISCFLAFPEAGKDNRSAHSRSIRGARVRQGLPGRKSTPFSFLAWYPISSFSARIIPRRARFRRSGAIPALPRWLVTAARSKRRAEGFPDR